MLSKYTDIANQYVNAKTIPLQQFYFTCSGSVIILKTIIVRLMKTHRYVAIILKSWIENWSKSFKSYNPKTKREKKQTPKQTKQNKTYKTKPKKKTYLERSTVLLCRLLVTLTHPDGFILVVVIFMTLYIRDPEPPESDFDIDKATPKA